jgi:dephospho-CoA kinase
LILLGLTGGIAMGKSRAASAFRARGVPVFDADAVVHALTGPGGSAVPAILAAFPGAGDEAGGIDRRRLGPVVFADPAALRRLEAVLHPRVRAEEGRFLRRCCRAGQPLAVLDIPLLFETGGEARVDRVAVVSAHPLLQRDRALRRPGMTEARLAQVRAKQTPDPAKRRRADYLIPSGHDRGLLAERVGAIVDDAGRLTPRAWPARWLRQGHGSGRRHAGA